MDEPWFSTLQASAAVDVAIRRGLIKGLAEGDEIAPIPALLETLLRGACVLRKNNPEAVLTPSFAAAWQADPAGLSARAAFIVGAARDVAGHLDAMLYELPDFMQGSHTFQLFRYDQALATDPDSLAMTAKWVAYLEALSRLEAPHLAPRIPIGAGCRLLEVGGNTGIMSAALCTTYDNVTATVVDLPAVCALGEKSAQGSLVNFVVGDARQPDALSSFEGQIDAVLFKSVLHDWPEADARQMMKAAIDIIPDGGQLIVCERGAYSSEDAEHNHMTSIANIVFAPFYRDPAFYADLMRDAGLTVAHDHVDLDMRFHIVSGRKS